MLCRRCRNLPCNTAQTVHQKLFQGPAAAIAGQHGQVMDVDIPVQVRIRNLFVIYLCQPVIGCHCAGIVQYQPAHGICDGGILLYPPVLHLYIIVHHVLIIQGGLFQVPYLLALLPVQDICLGHLRVPGFLQDLLHAVLDVFYRYTAIPHLLLEIRGYPDGQQVDDVIRVGLSRCLKRLLYG